VPRPALTEDDVRQKVAAYCARYRVEAPSATGMPPFPAGKRETKQHREWVVLYKAVQRVRKREAAGGLPVRAAALKTQRGRCPVCAEPAEAETAVLLDRSPAPSLALHAGCRDLLRLVDRLGPAVLDRLRALVTRD